MDKEITPSSSVDSYILREEVTWNDVPFYQYFAMWFISGIFWVVAFLLICL